MGKKKKKARRCESAKKLLSRGWAFGIVMSKELGRKW